MELSQVRLLVDDFGAAFRFYRDGLGLGVSFGDESSGYASFATRGATIAVFECAGQADAVDLRTPGESTLAVLDVDDVDGAVERLRAHVIGVPRDQPDWGGRVAYLRDPSGNLLELFQAIESQE